MAASLDDYIGILLNPHSLPDVTVRLETGMRTTLQPIAKEVGQMRCRILYWRMFFMQRPNKTLRFDHTVEQANRKGAFKH